MAEEAMKAEREESHAVAMAAVSATVFEEVESVMAAAKAAGLRARLEATEEVGADCASERSKPPPRPRARDQTWPRATR
jgi:hypothetical protein